MENLLFTQHVALQFGSVSAASSFLQARQLMQLRATRNWIAWHAAGGSQCGGHTTIHSRDNAINYSAPAMATVAKCVAAVVCGCRCGSEHPTYDLRTA